MHEKSRIKSEARGRERTEVRGRERTEVRGQRSEIRAINYRKTEDIIAVAEKGLLPDKIMLNTHPQRWDDRFAPWMKELVWQNVKNVFKRAMLAYWNKR